MSEIHLLEWFRDAPLPDVVPDPCVIVSGTGALGAFTDVVLRVSQPGHLALASAFTDSSIAEVLPSLRELRHQDIDLSVVTSGSRESWNVIAALGTFRWRSLQVRSLRGLHAKVYAFVGAQGASACLIGSHNLTRGGARHNAEVGVLLVSAAPSAIRGIAEACSMHIADLVAASKLEHDSLGPAPFHN